MQFKTSKIYYFSRTGIPQNRLKLQDDSYRFLIPPMASNELTWINVVISLVFVLFDIGVSTVFRLGIGVSLLIAGLRCVGQLALVATILHEVFETENPWLVFLICCASVLPSFSIQVDSHLLSLLVMLNFLGTFETGTSTSVRTFCLTS